MVRFAEWIALESFMGKVEKDVLLESVALESLETVFGYIRNGLRARRLAEAEGDEDDDGPAEIDDPFSGSEDAAPVEEIESGEEEEERSLSGGDEDGRRALRERKRLKTILDSLIVIRNEAKRERAEKVKIIASMKKEIDESDSDDLDSKSPLDALPYLVELGYLGKERGERIRSMILRGESKDRARAEAELSQKISAAATEEGNEYKPSSVSAKAAMEDLSEAMMQVFRGRFATMARRNQSLMSGRLGHVDYEADELASETIIYLLSRFKKRQWKEGNLLPWDANDKILESADLDHLKNYIFSAIKSMGSKMRVKKSSAMNPKSARRMKRDVTSVDIKAKTIRRDMKDEEFSFYLNYLEEAKKRPLRDRRDDEEIMIASTKEDRIRLAIMKDIEYKVTWTRVPSGEMSMEPGMIKRTLRTYLDMFLRRKEGSVTYASTLAGDNDEASSDELLSGAAFDHSAESDDEFDPRGVNPMHAVAAGGEEEMANNFASMAGTIKSAIENISRSGGQGPSEAMALCLKLGIKFTFTSELGRLGLKKPKTLVVTDVSKMHAVAASSGTSDCAGKILGMGLSFSQIRDNWPNGLWRPSLQSVGEYLRGNPTSKGAVQKFCDLFRIG